MKHLLHQDLIRHGGELPEPDPMPRTYTLRDVLELPGMREAMRRSNILTETKIFTAIQKHPAQAYEEDSRPATASKKAQTRAYFLRGDIELI